MLQKNRTLLKKCLKLIEKYLCESIKYDTPVVKTWDPDVIKKKMDISIKAKGIQVSKLIKLIDEYLNFSVRTSHPFFKNQLFSGFNFPAFIGEITTAFTNTSMATFEIAPVATIIENELISRINRLIGFKTENNNADGIMVTGGSNANMMAMLCARNRAISSIKQRGIRDCNCVSFVSDQSHYSFRIASNVLGLGTDNLVMVETDVNGCMRSDKLQEAIERTLACGKVPLFIGATAGTTVLGAFDSINDIADIAKKYNLWFHVDGAWGGLVILSRKHSFLLDGIDKADSFSFDAHKLMKIPLVASFFLCKHEQIIRETNSCSNNEYLFHDIEFANMDTGRKSLQCGRRVDALKVWLAWKYYGDIGYERMIDKLFVTASHIAQLIDKHPKLELIRYPQFLNICFRVIPDNRNIDINDFNLRIREYLKKSGKMLINYASFKDGTIFFRLIIDNVQIEEKGYEDLISLITDISQNFE